MLIRLLALLLLTAFMTCQLVAASPASAREVVRIFPNVPPGCDRPCSRMAVVFIHGLVGAESTWRIDERHPGFPEILQGDAKVGAAIDVYRIDFDSYWLNPSPGILDILESLERRLDGLFEKQQYTRIVLIGHSLGGILARGYLLHVKAKYGHGALSAFKQIFMIGTPSKGSSIADIAQYVSPNPTIRNLRSGKADEFRGLLDVTLDAVRQKRLNLHYEQLKFYVGYEKRNYGVLPKKIVTEESATAFGTEEPVPLDADHRGIVKPRNDTDPIYTWVRDRIDGCLSGSLCSAQQFTCNEVDTASLGFPDPNLEVRRQLAVRRP
jgi:pimeloyl-ACP methyl ester carboxylesterase